MIKIREAVISDSKSIIDFQISMALETENLKLDKIIVEHGVRKVFNDSSKGKYYVAEADNEIVASLMITHEWSDWRNGNVWWIQSVYVKPAFRKKKIFRSMYKYLMNIVENDNSLRGLRLYVDKSNINAQKVYEKVGMSNQHYQMYEWMKIF